MSVFADSHCHLDYFPVHERQSVIDAARLAGVAGLVTIATGARGFAEIEAIAAKDKNIWCTAGLHPCHIGEEPFNKEEIAAQAQSKHVVAIGETGLDYKRDPENAKEQKRIFLEHIDLARRYDKILVVHTRDADLDTSQILLQAYDEKPFRAILHCYNGSAALLQCGLACDFYFSFSGIVTFRKSNELRARLAEIPQDRLLIETDAPYLAPEPRRGHRNEPSLLIHTAHCLAKIKQCFDKDIAALTLENFCRAYEVSLSYAT